jgi:hypothetical protein
MPEINHAQVVIADTFKRSWAGSRKAKNLLKIIRSET